MDKREPTLVPQWYKPSAGSNSSSHSDEHSSGHSLRNIPLGNSCEYEAPHSSSSTSRGSSSFRRSTSSNGSVTNSRDSSGHSRPYGSFGRSHRDRDRGKDLDRRDRDRPHFVDNERDSFESLVISRNERDALRRSRSMISGKQGESWTKRLGNSPRHGVDSVGHVINGIGKVSFERDFPSLGAEEKHGYPEIVRVSSPVLSATAQTFPIGSSVKPGANGWTSALVISGSVGSTGSVVSSTMQNSTVGVVSTASTTTTVLNMAETLAQAPLRVRTEPQLSSDTQKKEDLARRQCAMLVPLTPSMPKGVSSEKSKPKGTRVGEFGVPSKVGQQSSQLMNNVLRAPPKADTLKTSPAGNFQVLHREKNGLSPTAKDGQSTTNANRVVNLLCAVPPATNGPLKCPSNPKVQVDSKGGALPSTLNSFREKRPHSQAQNRSDFFNSIRKKSSMNYASIIPDPTSHSPPGCEEKLGEVTELPSSAALEKEAANGGCLTENGNGDIGVYDACTLPENFVSDNKSPSLRSNPSIDPIEEAALLHTLGWEENGADEPLTEEEIFAFAKKYKQLKPSSEDDRMERVLRQLNSEPEA